MKVFVLLAGLLLAQSGSVDGARHVVVIEESQSGQTVDVKKSDDVQITFVAAGGTGFDWVMDSTKLATAKEEDVELSPGLPGGPLKRIFHIQLKKAGKVMLHFKFFRVWEKGIPPAKTFSVTLRVR